MSKPRYINANDINITGLTFEDVNNEVYFSLTDIRKAIEQTPAADVVEVRHGEWKICSDGYYPYCSRCRYEPEISTRYSNNLTPYCPNCGAKMDGERKARG